MTLAFLEEQLEQPAHIRRAFQLPISDLLNCFLHLVGVEDPSTSVEAFNYLNGLTALSVPVWNFPVMFMQLLHSSTIYPLTALHSLSSVYVLWLAYFAQTFLDLPSISADSHTWSINFSCCQPASHQKLSTWLPSKAWRAFFLPFHFSFLGKTRGWKTAEAGAGDTTTFPDSHSLPGQRTSEQLQLYFWQ